MRPQGAIAPVRTERLVYDGRQFHRIPADLTPGAWVRSLETPVLERVASGAARFQGVEARSVQRPALCELNRRLPSRERAADAGAAARAARRWLPVVPVLTNYSNGGH